MSRPKKTQTNTEEKKVETPLTLTIEFLWLETRPDNRQFRQNSILLNPVSVNVGVQVPLKPEYVLNSSDIILYQLDQGGTPLPVLTPKGLRYCLDQLDYEFSDSIRGDDTIADENLEWEDTPEETKEPVIESNTESEWSDDEDEVESDTDDLKETDFQWE